MKTVVLIGTSHKFQYPAHGEHAEGIQDFHKNICMLCNSFGIRAIAEEMSLDVIKEKGLASSGVQQLCADKGLCHQFSDPSKEERMMLGILQECNIRAKGFLDDWNSERIDLEILASYRIRENYWMSKIKELDTWPLLFICGADHFYSFSNLLSENGIEVVEAYQDWEPKN